MAKLPLLLIPLLVLMGCGSPQPAQPAAATSDVHLVVSVQGLLSVKRAGWSTYAPVRFGTALRNGDLLRLDDTAQATVVCANLSIATVHPGSGGVPCPIAPAVLTYRGSLISTTRAPQSGDFPQVVVPAKTQILDPHPTIRWTAVANVDSYEVHVRGPGVEWSAAIHGATEVSYPADAPPLATGVTYKVTVVAGGRSSDEETTPGLGFTMLQPDQATAVRDAEAKIRTLQLPDAPTRLLVANLYASQGLYAEAIEQLEALTAEEPEPSVARALGDLYVAVGLNRLAEQPYLRALELSEHANDLEGQALAQHALGRIYEAIGNIGEAAQRLQKASTLYQQLGDAQTIKQIEERLAGLPKP